ncbi:putative secondary metabolism biosyntheticenzyme, partial [Clathrus columnatus]
MAVLNLQLQGFTPLPNKNNLTLDQAHEWHRIHSSFVPAFVYPDDDGHQQAYAINIGAQYIKAQIPEILQDEANRCESLTVGVLASIDGPMQNLFDGALKHLRPEEVPICLAFPTYETLFYHEADQRIHCVSKAGDVNTWNAHGMGNQSKYCRTRLPDKMLTFSLDAMGWFASSWAVYAGFIRSIRDPLSSKSPSDPESVLHEMVKTKTTIGYTPSSFLEAWANDPQSLELLKSLKVIFWGGGPLSAHTGQYLIGQGVRMTIMYGTTEVGNVSSLTDKTYLEGFEWFCLPPSLDPVFLPDPTEPNTFELVFKVTAEHHLAVINREIDGIPAYATNDLVERHPTNHRLYRIKGRADEQIILSTGEKNPHVKTSVIFGRGRTSNGVIVEPVSFDEAERLGLEKFKPFVYTAKGTPRRGAIINEYGEEIENLYRTVENYAQTDIPSPLELDQYGGWPFEATRNFVRAVVHSIMRNSLGMRDEDDLFAHGCDSLQATYIRNTILHALRRSITSSNVQSLPNNLVYQHPTVNALAEAVSQGSKPKASVGETDWNADRRKRLEKIITDYTRNWLKHHPGCVQGPYPEVIFLTGSTGGLGSQILAELISTDPIKRIYAFNRPSKKSLRQRHVEAFTNRGNDVSLLDSEKIIFVEGDTSAENLGVDIELFEQIRDSVTTIIHTAWRVDFNISLISYETAICGVRHLIDLALSSPHTTPPQLVFTSSIETLAWANVPPIKEAAFKNVDLITDTGYTESKWISEQILESSSLETSLKPIIVRVGQLSGGINGNWNTQEWFPALVKVSQTLKAVPATEGLVSFIPLHTAAKALVELRHSSCTFANLVHPRPITWNVVIGWVGERLKLPILPYSEWLRKLELLPRTSETLSHNPALHILDFYRAAMPTNETPDLENQEAMGIATYDSKNTVLNAPSMQPDRLPRLCRDDIY